MANILAIAVPDVSERAFLKDRLEQCEAFDVVRESSPPWLVATSALPGSQNPHVAAEGMELVFAEGIDRFPDEASRSKLALLTSDSPHRLGRVRGDFGFLALSRSQAVVVRSCAGTVPFYVRRWEDKVAVSTQLRSITEWTPGPFSADLLMCLASDACEHFIDGRTFVQGVSAVQVGCAVDLLRRGPEIEYWQPFDGNERCSGTGAEELRSIIDAGLVENLDPSGDNMLLLSGGVDSAAIASALRALDGEFAALSLIPGERSRRARELSFIESISWRTGADSNTCVPLSPDLYRWLMGHQPVLPFPARHPLLKLLADPVQWPEPPAVVLGGDNADVVCGHIGRIGDWASAAQLAQGDLRLSRLPFGVRDWARWLKRAAGSALGAERSLVAGKDLPPWVGGALRAEYGEWHSRYERQRRTAPAHADLAEATAANLWVAQHWELTSPRGIRRFSPFLTRESIELAIKADPVAQLRGAPKRGLRQAMRGVCPSRNLLRADKGAWGASMRTSGLRVEPGFYDCLGEALSPQWRERHARQVPLPAALPLAAASAVVGHLSQG